ncbi:interleukin-2 receptor subunit alpha isoform X3 [Desmodus rotundus]|uniref:interleukin-2 receptor subunit alpha isoform X3 n=1 Tax=Desmodus rotundus TaxID=9430 RepID=UPI001E1C19A2|nr:interleukin-2 receptor subunit alpha isoform X3 [Desmodus rotundus]
MERSLLMWRFFTFIMVTDCVIELCHHELPHVSHATYKALTYKIGTLINCDCKKGFRRLSNRSPYMTCTGNSGHSSWGNQCQCTNISLRNRQKQATPTPEEQKKGKNTEMQSQMQPTDQVNQDHCREPPPWEHEGSKRIYHFVVGQTVYYECAQGFRALQRGPAKSTCKMTCGEGRWTQPQLKCIREDFEKRTEVATTTKMFIFTIEYQIAVAGCVLLLITILLLSAFTWQRRWFSHMAKGPDNGAVSNTRMSSLFLPILLPLAHSSKLQIDSFILPCGFIRRAQRHVHSTGQLK